jgi:methyl-accepting chemotaxis protein
MITKIKNWIRINFLSLTTLICLLFTIQLLIKQKNQITELQDSIDFIKSELQDSIDFIKSEDYNKRFDEIDSKLNNVENDIENINRAIRYGL